MDRFPIQVYEFQEPEVSTSVVSKEICDYDFNLPWSA